LLLLLLLLKQAKQSRGGRRAIKERRVETKVIVEM
jgi:hypothetical protein